MNPKEQYKAAVRYVQVEEGQEGQRIDNFLMRELGNLPKTLIYRILRKGEVRVNKGRIKPNYRLCLGDEIRIPPLQLQPRSEVPTIGVELQQRMSQTILYDDDDMLVVNKPAGMAVHGGTGLSVSLIHAYKALYPKCPQLELVHRLDKETSGCLILAKKRNCLRRLHELLRQGGVEKSYVALVQGRWRKGECEIQLPLLKQESAQGGASVKVSEKGKMAISRFRPKQYFSAATLMEINLLTGRTHQIRVHCQHLGHPVAGDLRYGEKDFNSRLKSLGLKRMFLHAAVLSFPHPSNEKKIEIVAALPTELEELLINLGKEKN